MIEEFDMKNRKDKSGTDISLPYQNASKGATMLAFLFDGRIAMNSTYVFTKNALRSYLGINPGLFWNRN
jgi:hypothetical protein